MTTSNLHALTFHNEGLPEKKSNGQLFFFPGNCEIPVWFFENIGLAVKVRNRPTLANCKLLSKNCQDGSIYLFNEKTWLYGFQIFFPNIFWGGGCRWPRSSKKRNLFVFEKHWKNAQLNYRTFDILCPGVNPNIAFYLYATRRDIFRVSMGWCWVVSGVWWGVVTINTHRCVQFESSD